MPSQVWGDLGTRASISNWSNYDPWCPFRQLTAEVGGDVVSQGRVLRLSRISGCDAITCQQRTRPLVYELCGSYTS